MNSLVSASVEGVRAQLATVGEARLSSVASQEACGTECYGDKEADSHACGCVVRECGVCRVSSLPVYVPDIPAGMYRKCL